MENLIWLLEDVVAMMRSCPAIVDVLDGADAIVPYLDITTGETNSLLRIRYMMPKGCVMVAWQTSDITEGDMEGWGHQLDVYVQARRGESSLLLLNAVIDGVPEGGAVRWRYLCVNEWTLPAEVMEITRLTDEEQIDYYVIRMLFREKGDDSYGVSR